MNFETWKEFYNFGWATEEQLEEAVSLGELTQDQYDQIIGITDTPVAPKEITPKQSPVKETTVKEAIPKEEPTKEIAPKEIAPKESPAKEVTTREKSVTEANISIDDKENEKDDDVKKKSEDILIPRG